MFDEYCELHEIIQNNNYVDKIKRNTMLYTEDYYYNIHLSLVD